MVNKSSGDNALNAWVAKRFIERADPSLGKPANAANWMITYDTVQLYADILRRNGIDGTTDPKKAREAIKNEFVKLKSFKGIHSFTFRDNGDGHVPEGLLPPDVQRHIWKFAGQ